MVPIVQTGETLFIYEIGNGCNFLHIHDVT